AQAGGAHWPRGRPVDELAQNRFDRVTSRRVPSCTFPGRVGARDGARGGGWTTPEGTAAGTVARPSSAGTHACGPPRASGGIRPAVWSKIYRGARDISTCVSVRP